MQRNIMYHLDQSEFSKGGWLSTILSTRRRDNLKKQSRPSKVAVDGQEEIIDNNEEPNAADQLENAFELIEDYAHDIRNEEDGMEFF